MSDKECNPEQKDPMEMLPYRFIENMMDAVGKTVDEKQAAQILRGCSCAHYRLLDVDSMISEYAGRLKDFIDFIESKWGWKIYYDAQNGIIEADENKPFCVCPLVRNGGIKNPLLCHCSEGFAKKMFSLVTGKPVSTEIAKSILRGDSSCVYRIIIGD